MYFSPNNFYMKTNRPTGATFYMLSNRSHGSPNAYNNPINPIDKNIHFRTLINEKIPQFLPLQIEKYSQGIDAMIETETHVSEFQEKLPVMFPLLPLKNVVILPKSIIPIIVGRPLSIKAVEYALKHDRSLFITAQKDQDCENPTQDDMFAHGTRSTILQVMRMPNGALKILAEGMCRAKAEKFETADGFVQVTIQDLPTTGLDKEIELEALWRQLQNLYHSYSQLNEKVPTDIIESVKNVLDMDYVTDTIAVHINNLTFNERQEILELPHLQERMLKVCQFLKKEIEILQTEQRIRGRIHTQVEKSQREYYLNEQMKAIQKELGRDDQSDELDVLRKKIKTLGLKQDTLEKAEKELRRLEQMP